MGKEQHSYSSKKEYVKYLQNYKSRALIDFTKGRVRIETLGSKKDLKQSIVMTLLLPDDPRSVDLFGAKNVKLGGMPYLFGEVQDEMGKNIRYKWHANRYANILLKNNYKTTALKRNGKSVKMSYVEFPIVRDHANIRVAKFKPLVKKYAKKYNISENLVYAIIKTESDFNQFAVSRLGAYGLMQIMPKTAGRDAYLHVKGKKYTPSKEYLFNANNNIELGVAYLNILDKKYLAGIYNFVSREYCVISAYNTGSGNVLKIFHKDRQKAKRVINGLGPQSVYAKLRKRLPYKETRRYLQKVVIAKKSLCIYKREGIPVRNIYLIIAKQIVEEAGKIIKEARETNTFSYEFKKDNTPVTNIDQQVQEYMTKCLKDSFDIQVMGEEQYIGIDTSKPYWAIDPIDGTWAFITHENTSAINLSLIENKEVTVGIVFNPFTNEFFQTEKGAKSYIGMSTLPLRDNPSVAVVNFKPKRFHPIIKSLNQLFKEDKVKKLTSIGGSITYSMCMVAKGAYSNYIAYFPKAANA